MDDIAAKDIGNGNVVIGNFICRRIELGPSASITRVPIMGYMIRHIETGVTKECHSIRQLRTIIKKWK